MAKNVEGVRVLSVHFYQSFNSHYLYLLLIYRANQHKGNLTPTERDKDR